jgi:two-component system sensor histidine kinase KdpD
MCSSAKRGSLRTYLGIAPGVGKTYVMLRQARAERRRGRDVAVAYLERHGRPATTAQVSDLEVLPRRTIDYRGTSFEDMDLEAVLERRPELAVVDELAHADLPGSRHEKRWQDVDELIAHGIDVYTTLNVANIESLGELVAQITGVHPAEPVPDDFVRSGEVLLIDLEPAALRRRLAEGLVFPEQGADEALSHYFRFANLAALRELAQLWLDEAVSDPVAAFVAAHGLEQAADCNCVVVGLEGSASDEWLIRYAARLAELSEAPVRGVHVRADDNLERAPAELLEQDRNLLAGLNGTLVETSAADVASGLIRAAREAGASQLVIGRRHHSRLSRKLRESTADRILRAAGDLPVQLVNVGRPALPGGGRGLPRPGHRRPAAAP